MTLDSPLRGRYTVLVRAADAGRPLPLNSTAWLNVVLVGPARRTGTLDGLGEKTWKTGMAAGKRFDCRHHVTRLPIYIIVGLLCLGAYTHMFKII